MLSEAICEKTNPRLSPHVITHERLGGHSGLVVPGGILRWEIPDFSEPEIPQRLRIDRLIGAGKCADGVGTNPPTDQIIHRCHLPRCRVALLRAVSRIGWVNGRKG